MKSYVKTSWKPSSVSYTHLRKMKYKKIILGVALALACFSSLNANALTETKVKKTEDVYKRQSENHTYKPLSLFLSNFNIKNRCFYL